MKRNASFGDHPKTLKRNFYCQTDHIFFKTFIPVKNIIHFFNKHMRILVFYVTKISEEIYEVNNEL